MDLYDPRLGSKSFNVTRLVNNVFFKTRFTILDTHTIAQVSSNPSPPLSSSFKNTQLRDVIVLLAPGDWDFRAKFSYNLILLELFFMNNMFDAVIIKK